ncbi:unnamed protein product [Rotaria sp. Silwood1]|nr:unnamed protein product [Rotaria sp. Silwood1]CAF1508656.1 unnamed protein product [Rotaria sp. Silwood1]CAF3659458.1 unnamed protein product [Rotaria sp. Silwood1]CAF4901151.1 unnamed protein product [Rotaria sp. Silwood1]
MSETKEWSELVGQTFEAASQIILQFDSILNPYNARNGIQNEKFDPNHVVCVTNNDDIVIEVPSYTYP